MNVGLRHLGGFSLIEVLVSVLVLALGLFGIAALQLSSIRDNHAALLRSVAVAQANNMIDRMRGNYDGVQAGYYNSLSGTPSDPSCTTCTNSETAIRDAYQWNTTNASLLPGGQGTVFGNGSLYTITVRWDEDRTGVSGIGCSGNPQVDLMCFRMEVQL